METREPAVVRDTDNPSEISGNIPTMMNSLVPNAKLSKIKAMTGMVNTFSFFGMMLLPFFFPNPV